MGGDYEETYSAKGILNNGVASDISYEELISETGLTMQELYITKAPSLKEMDALDPIYVSYFLPWNSFANYEFARKHGFHDLSHEWNRTHHIENFDQIDSRAYLVHPWMKYPKFGHGFATDYASRMIRYGIITRKHAIELIREYDYNLDPLCVRDFCEFTGYTETEFWAIIDKFYNTELFEKIKWGNGH